MAATPPPGLPAPPHTPAVSQQKDKQGPDLLSWAMCRLEPGCSPLPPRRPRDEVDAPAAAGCWSTAACCCSSPCVISSCCLSCLWYAWADEVMMVIRGATLFLLTPLEANQSSSDAARIASSYWAPKVVSADKKGHCRQEGTQEERGLLKRKTGREREERHTLRQTSCERTVQQLPVASQVNPSIIDSATQVPGEARV